MQQTKRVLSIRVSGKEKKEKTRNLLYNLAHFRNILIIFIRNYKELYNEWILNQSILYGLLSSRGYSGKHKEEFEKVFGNISKDEKLKELLKDMRKQKEKIDNPHFIQSVIRQVIKDFRSFQKAYKEFRKNTSKFRGIPKPPKPKKLRYIINFSAEGSRNTFERKKDYIIIKLREGEYLKVKLPKDFPDISSVRLKLFGEDLYVDVVYEHKVEEKNTKGKYRAGIDIGLDELVSVVSENPSLKSFIISGREIKTFNQWFNKERAKIRSQMDYLRNEIREGAYEEEDLKKLERKQRDLEVRDKILSAYRKRWMDTQLHRIARKVVDLLYETGHKTIYIGKNALGGKRGIHLGKVNNQNFVFIPFRRLINLIKYKARELGMKVIEVDERYTSKTSPFVSIFKVQETGERKLCKGERRGNLFNDRVLNKVFHADLVGALNILRVGAKLLELSFYRNLKVLFIKLCNPVRLKLMDLFFKVTPESLLGIGGSSEGHLCPSGLSPRAVKSNRLNTFCS